MLTVKQLDEMNQLDIEKIDKSGLVDICGTQIDTNLPPEQRMMDYLEQVKNPYCFLCGETPVKVCFAPESDDLGKKIKTYFLGLKR